MFSIRFTFSRCLGRFFGADTRQHLIFELANQGDLFDELRASDFQMPFAERILGLGLIWTVSPFSYMFQALSRPITHREGPT